MYFWCIQIKYVHFHNIKFKMPKSQLLIRLETSCKNGEKAQHAFPIKSIHLVLSPPPCVVSTLVKMLTIMDGPML